MNKLLVQDKLCKHTIRGIIYCSPKSHMIPLIVCL